MALFKRSSSATIPNKVALNGEEAVPQSTKPIQKTLHYDQLPTWMKIDPYIRLGYRRQLNSFHECFWSLFYLHNESVNIWSHLVPAIGYFVAVFILDLHTFHSGIKIPTADMVFFQFYLLSTGCCLLLSAIYHCTNSHSEQISRYFLKLDYFGIVLSAMGTNASAAYFGFYGHLFWQVFYFVGFVTGAAYVYFHLLRNDVDGPCACTQRFFPFHPRPT